MSETPTPIDHSTRKGQAEFQGSRFVKCGCPITLGCISPEARDCLDRVMDEWNAHRKRLPKQIMGKQYRPGVYAFAYWLIRWSGLVQPVPEDRTNSSGIAAAQKKSIVPSSLEAWMDENDKEIL